MGAITADTDAAISEAGRRRHSQTRGQEHKNIMPLSHARCSIRPTQLSPVLEFDRHCYESNICEQPVID